MDTLDQEWNDRKNQIKIIDLDIEQASEVIEKVLRTTIVPFLWGPPGVGKSSMVRAIAEKKNWVLKDVRLSLLNPVDLRGLPVINKETKQADWYPPADLPRYDIKEIGILFLDEINLAPLATQAAAYQLILDKKIGEYRFPPHWKIIAAGNRETDRANVYKLAAPLANRFTHFNIQPNFKTWRHWATANKIRPEVIDFLVLRSSLLLQMPTDAEKAFPSPRTWSFVSDLLTAFEFDVDNPESEYLNNMIVGTIGKGVGLEFIASLQDYKIKGVSRMVDEYVATGKYEMPKSQSLRYAFIMAIFDAYLSDRLDPMRYKTFFDTLSGEEKKVIENFEKEHGAKIIAKRKKLKMPQPDMTRPMAEITKDIEAVTDRISISNTSIFTTTKALIYDNNGNVEYISFDGGDFNSIFKVKRGQDATSARNWPKGSYIQSI